MLLANGVPVTGSMTVRSPKLPFLSSWVRVLARELPEAVRMVSFWNPPKKNILSFFTGPPTVKPA